MADVRVEEADEERVEEEEVEEERVALVALVERNRLTPSNSTTQ